METKVRFTVHPQKGLSDLFYLGSPLGDVINKIQHFDYKTNLKYSSSNPFNIPVILDLLQIGVSLRFEPKTQRLILIELYNFDQFDLFYNNSEVNSSQKIPTLLSIYKIFGPIYPGEYDQLNSRYILNYPGVTFLFPIPEKVFHSSLKDDIPVSFRDGSTPILSRMYIYNGESFKTPTLPHPHQPSISTPLKSFNGYIPEEVFVYPKIGVSFPFRRLDSTPQGVFVALHKTLAQDILVDFGPPDQIFVKKEQTMGIHKRKSDDDLGNETNGDDDDERGELDSPVEDYFWNYFGLGFDFLFDGKNHFVKKVVLQSNAPGHLSFMRYRRCFFKIFDSVDDESSSEWKADYLSLYDEVEHEFGPALGSPVVYNRAPSEYVDQYGLVSHSTKSGNPFGSTQFFGMRNMLIFEVMSNGCIASLTVV